MRYAVIMAGGSGKRLWPASRHTKPKQLIRLLGDKSLMEMAIGRLEGLFPPERLMIVTNAIYAEQVAKTFPRIPRENIIGEPVERDTANAIALAAEVINARDPKATMAVFTADHIIRPVDDFRQCVEKACQVAEANRDALVTFGIRPSWPHTGLGYIHCGPETQPGVRKVVAFKEKPDHHTARTYVESGEYFWNSGMFVWCVSTVRQTLREHLPASADEFARIGQAASAGQDLAPLLREVYPNLQKISIDYAVMEKAQRVMMVELTCEWLDLGSWPALADVVEVDEDDNAVVARRAVVLDGSRNVIFSEDGHLVAVVGMDDCIIVHTADVTLVCNKSDSQRLKELVDMIGRKFGDEYI